LEAGKACPSQEATLHARGSVPGARVHQNSGGLARLAGRLGPLALG
jgi:hypothetical protein